MRATYLTTTLITAGFLALAQPGLAAGGDSPTPQPTQTTKECKNGKIWSEKKKRCVKPGNASLDDDQRYLAVREYAWSGKYHEAQTILSVMADQSDDRVLTYWGFTHRKLGDVDLGMAFYNRAIEVNPDNLLARSYMGQAHVEAGEKYLAWVQLREIRARGGEGQWAEQSLAEAIRTGTTYSH